MKIWYAPYELVPLSALNRFRGKERRGFLIKIQNKDLEAGYADCHPIAEFGDGTAEVLIKKLQKKTYTPLLKRALHLAKLDGQARAEKKRLLTSEKVKSHFTCADIQTLDARFIESLVMHGFSTIKIKVGSDTKMETEILNSLPSMVRSALRWRFDANSGGGDTFLKNLDEDFAEYIDFIEDPVPFRLKTWESLSKKYRVACAYDRPMSSKTTTLFRGIRVLKPAREAVTPRKVDIITNSMDHPVGQSFAVWAAQNAIHKFHGQTNDFGLQTAHLFKKNPFFDQISTSVPFFRVSDDGYGIGFQKLLEKQQWRSV